MKSALKVFLAIALFCVLAPSVAFAGGDKKQSVSIGIGNDFYAAGDAVELKSEVEDDAFLAGAIVNITKRVTHDLMAAGSTLTILSEIGDDLRALGSVLTIAAPIGGDAIVAGGVVNLTENSTIGGDASFAGGMLNFDGAVGGDLQLAGDEISFGGTVGGDALIRVGKKISFADDAKIDGKLTYFSKKEVVIPDGIASTVERKNYEKFDDFTKESFPKKAAGTFFMLIVGFVAGAVLLALLGRASETLANNIREKFWWSLLTGAVTLFVPLLAILLAVTIVGSWLAGILLAAWVLGLLATGALVGFTVGSLLIRQKKDTKFSRKLLTLALGWIVFVAIGFIPGFGGILKFTIFVLTLGAGVLTKVELYKKMKTAKLL